MRRLQRRKKLASSRERTAEKKGTGKQSRRTAEKELM